MKIAILTFFESENYGTVLQSYATQQYLQALGHDAELLYLKRMVNGASVHYAKSIVKPTFFERLRYKAVSLLEKKNIQNKREAFNRFRSEYLRVSKFYESVDALKNDLDRYDLYISGGDQIWNPYHKVFSLNYMLQFLPADKPRISYGSSFGVANIEDASVLSSMQACLRSYQAIGIREQSGVRIVEQMGLEAQQVVDPVFLLKDEWGHFVGKSPKKKKYCLVYALIGYPVEENKKIQAFAKAQNLDIVILPYNRKNCQNNFGKAFGISPEEFLNYIAHAEYIFTNSFHGLAFSIIFQKQFALLGCDSEEGIAKRERLVDLLEQFQIGDRSFKNAHSAIDYNVINELMQTKVSESKKYIKENIDKIGEN